MIERRNGTKNVIIAILVILVLALGGYCSYITFFKENNIEKKECDVVKNDEKKEETVSIQNKLEIYGKKSETGAYHVCNHPNDTDNCKNILFTIKTDNPNASIIHTNLDEEYVVFYDNGVKLYNTKDDSVSNLDIDLNGNIEWLSEGFIHNGEDEAYYFDLKLNKKTLDKYDEIYPLEDINSDNDVNNIKFLRAKKGKNSVVIDFKTGNVVITIDNSDYEAVSFEKKESYIIASLHGVEDTTKVIYNTKGEKKVELKDNEIFEIMGSKIIVYEQSLKKVKEY